MTTGDCMSSCAGDLVSDLLEPIMYLMTPRMEDRSTEEVVAQLQEVERVIRNEQEDRAMAASLDQQESTRIVGNFVEVSTIDVAGVDWEAAQVMVASHWNEDKIRREGMETLLPKRRSVCGKRPGPTTREVVAKRSRWTGGEGVEQEGPQGQQEVKAGDGVTTGGDHLRGELPSWAPQWSFMDHH